MYEQGINNGAMQPINAQAKPAANLSEIIVTVFDGNNPPRDIRLSSFGKPSISFGREKGNDIVLTSKIVSGEHGRFVFNGTEWFIEDKAAYRGQASTNGLIYNNRGIIRKNLSEGDFIRIDDGVETIAEGVLFTFALAGSASRWAQFPTAGKPVITIGRDASCDIKLPHVSISKRHAMISQEGGRFFITDTNSTNGVLVNGRRVTAKTLLHEKDVIAVANSKLIFTTNVISYVCNRSGISVDASNIVIKRGKGKKSFVTGNNISMSINPGELIAVIGGSGAGKSTILNCMCGYLPPASGEIYINGVNLYENFDYLKRIYGYVPQQDIVYDNLTLHDMLEYTAKLRLPKDTTPEEREAAIDRAIKVVELTEKKNAYIKALSGGQRKRASIAVELLPDPNLIFLDEPASGLDPGTERSLMTSLRKMADSGKTVILVTHSTLQLKMCDKIAFMGKGGNLCYFGSHDSALKFFGVDDVVDVYNMITEHAPEWRAHYDRTMGQAASVKRTDARAPEVKKKSGRQLGVLCSRYFKLVFNDRQRLMLLFAMPLIITILISFVANGTQFEQAEHTKSLMFSLACGASFLGVLNAIQEICKERTILKREYMTGLSLTSYLMSKIFVLGIISIFQSLIIVTIFSVIAGLPTEGLITLPFIELFITTLLTEIASMAMGLMVSALFNSPDRAMTIAPLLLLPQILFAGIVFKLEGILEKISWFAICRWSIEGYGTTSNINSQDHKMYMESPKLRESLPGLFEDDKAFDFATSHLIKDWVILAAFVIGFMLIARIVLSNLKKETN